MSGAKHTAEPWRERMGDILTVEQKDGDDVLIAGVGKSCGTRSAPYWPVKAGKPEGKANATRIVECVNALEGIDNPAAFREVFGELVEALAIADDLLNCGEIQSMAKKARLKGFVPDVRKVSQALAKAKEIQS